MEFRWSDQSIEISVGYSLHIRSVFLHTVRVSLRQSDMDLKRQRAKARSAANHQGLSSYKAALRAYEKVNGIGDIHGLA